MLRVFQTDIMDPEQFVVTLELVPGRESAGRSVDTVTVQIMLERISERINAAGDPDGFFTGCAVTITVPATRSPASAARRRAAASRIKKHGF